MAKCKVTVNIPERPQGDVLVIPPCGAFENGKPRVLDLTEDLVKLLEAAYGVTVEKSKSKGGDNE